MKQYVKQHLTDRPPGNVFRSINVQHGKQEISENDLA